MLCKNPTVAGRKAWLVALFAVLVLAGVTSGQRVITSLGTKLKRFQAKDGSTKSRENDVSSCEAGSVFGACRSIAGVLSRHELEMWILSLIAITFSVLYWWWKPMPQGGDGESSEVHESRGYLKWGSHSDIGLMTFPFFTIPDEIKVENGRVKTMVELENLELGFSDIRMEILTGKKSVDGGKKVLLDGSIRGVARPGRMLAIMGPSGAGKVSYS